MDKSKIYFRIGSSYITRNFCLSGNFISSFLLSSNFEGDYCFAFCCSLGLLKESGHLGPPLMCGITAGTVLFWLRTFFCVHAGLMANLTLARKIGTVQSSYYQVVALLENRKVEINFRIYSLKLIPQN